MDFYKILFKQCVLKKGRFCLCHFWWVCCWCAWKNN